MFLASSEVTPLMCSATTTKNKKQHIDGEMDARADKQTQRFIFNAGASSIVSPTHPHHPHPDSSLLVTLKLRLNSYCCFASDPFSAVIRFSKQPLTVRSP